MHRLTTIDVNVAGEPLRVITAGFTEPIGSTILEKLNSCRTHLDHLRRILTWEPRGHRDMYGCMLVSSSTQEADVGVLFFHNEGYSTMCGHGIIGLTTVMLENGLFPMKEPTTTICFETPSGLVKASASIKERKVQSVSFINVPSFVVDFDKLVDIPGIGSIKYDLAFGGAFYAFCQAETLDLELTPKRAGHIKNLGMLIKKHIAANQNITHPIEDALGFLYGTIFVGPPQTPEGYIRQVCIFADGALDRSPTGTGISAHLALLKSKGKIQLGQSLQFESILGTRFSGKVTRETMVGKQPAIISRIEGLAYLTGNHEFFSDPDDPLGEGFLL